MREGVGWDEDEDENEDGWCSQGQDGFISSKRSMKKKKKMGKRDRKKKEPTRGKGNLQSPSSHKGEQNRSIRMKNEQQ